MRKPWTWRMNPVVLGETEFREKLKEQWSRWRRAKCFYPNSLEWWERYAKRMIKRTFQREGAERNKDRKELENFYYDVMYQAIRNPTNHQNTARKLKEMKAKIMTLHIINKGGILMDTVEKDRLPGEEVTLHQYIKSRKRRLPRTVSHVTDEHGSFQTD
jgi:hypothetical protein